jgi:hypothetical protein
MGLFDFMKKKKEDLPLPPPPSRPSPAPLGHPEVPNYDDVGKNIPPPEFPGNNELPDLPDLPELPSADEKDNYAHRDGFSGFKGDFEPIRPSLSTEMPDLPDLPEIPSSVSDEGSRSDWVEPPELDLPDIKDHDIELPRKRIIPDKAFVSVDEYKRIFDESNRIREKIIEAENLLGQLSELKDSEEKLFDKWHGEIENIEKRLSYVDQVISKAQR